jgi:PKD repeat protein
LSDEPRISPGGFVDPFERWVRTAAVLTAVAILVFPGGTLGTGPASILRDRMALTHESPSLPAGPISPRTESPGPAFSDARCLPLGGDGPACAARLAPSAPAASALAWFNVTATSSVLPDPILWPSSVFDPVDESVVLFGGCTGTTCPSAPTTWSFAHGQWNNLTSLGPQPPARSYTSMAWDGTDGYGLLFGGSGGTVDRGDTWSYLGGHWTDLNLSAPAAPSPRWGQSLIYDPSDGVVVLFGGHNSVGGFLDDTWTFSGGAWTNITGSAGTSPSPRAEASMVWDASTGNAILMDGCGASVCPLNDTWRFDGHQWSNRTGSALPLPPARLLASMSDYPALGQVLLFGGIAGTTSLGDTWAWDGNGWTELSSGLSSTPRAREGATMPEDLRSWTSSGHVDLPYALLYGGDYIPCGTCTLVPIHDSWVYEPPMAVSVAGPTGIVETGTSANLSVTATGGTPPYDVVWSFGDGGSAAAPNVGHVYSAPGTYPVDVAVTDDGGATVHRSMPVVVTPGPHGAIAGPVASDVNRTVAFNATFSAGTPPYQYSWDFDDGTRGTSRLTVHEYDRPGTYTINVSVADAVGGVGVASWLLEINPELQVVLSVSPSPVTPGALVTFVPTVVGGTAPFSYAWSFGDGGNDRGVAPTHVYPGSGSYSVTLRVNDSVGATALTSRTVDVASPGGGSPPSNSAGGSLLGNGWTWVALLAVAVAAVAIGLLLLRRRRGPGASRPPAKAEPPEETAEWDENAPPPSQR